MDIRGIKYIVVYFIWVISIPTSHIDYDNILAIFMISQN